MSAPVRVQKSYSLGMKRDSGREDLPEGAVWNLVDLFPDILGANLRKRGGYEYASQDLSAVQATASYVAAGIQAPFAGGSKNLAFDEDGRVYAILSSSSTTDIGDVLTTISPAFYDDKVIVPHSGGTTSPKQITYNGSSFTVANLGGTPPAGRYALIYKDVLWLAAPSASADRIFFSVAGQPGATWDTTNKYLDVSYPITGMAALSNAVLVFSLERTARVRGSIPPPDTDFIVDDPIFEVGCTDSRSVVNYRDKVVWANAQGLWISDGSAVEDLSAMCGMKAWWLDVMGGRDGFSTGTPYSTSSWTISGQVHRDYYIYSVMNGTSKVDSGLIDLRRYTWTRIKNLDAVCMWQSPYPSEVFFGRRGAARVAKLSSIFVPAAGNKSDADGTSIEPVIETGFFGYDATMKTFRTAFLEYDIRDSGSDNPYLTVSYIDSPEETSYTSLSPTATETTELSKEHMALNFPARGVAFRVAQTNPSSDTRIYGVGVHAYAREGNR